MGLSRNKVAVSEGAAGSPPFYGALPGTKVSGQGKDRKDPKHDEVSEYELLLFNFQGLFL